jgi:tetratricopeptide (TPR) repeat protein
MKNQGEIVFDKRLLPAGDAAVLACCVRAKSLEESGDYEAARGELAARWRGAGHRPVITGLGPLAAAELLVRAGVLTGWLGSAQQLSEGQEAAKDLITEGMRGFEELGESAKAAEAQTELALCYWRLGEFDEGRLTIQGALEKLGEADTELRARALLRLVTIDWSAGNLDAALRTLKDEGDLFAALDNDYLKGCFYSQRGLIYMLLIAPGKAEDYADRALVDYAAASFHFYQAGHARYQARVENNHGYLLWVLGRFAEAHEHLTYARGLFAGLKDKGGAGQVDETQARVFLGESHYDKAEAAAKRAVIALEAGGERSQLSEALTTLGTALARLERADEAKEKFQRAIQVAEVAGDTTRKIGAALTLVEELSGQLTPQELWAAYEVAERLIGPETQLETLRRMISCARRISVIVNQLPAIQVPCDLKKELRLFERNFIVEALRTAGGSVTRAARLLGFKHPNSLLSIIDSRHQDLLDFRPPPMKRRRSILKGRTKR